jgi:hypothetical protein
MWGNLIPAMHLSRGIFFFEGLEWLIEIFFHFLANDKYFKTEEVLNLIMMSYTRHYIQQTMRSQMAHTESVRQLASIAIK